MKAISDRLSHPVMGVFALSFVAVNWEPIFFLIVSDEHADVRIVNAKAYCSQSSLIWAPLALTFMYVALSPVLKAIASVWDSVVEKRAAERVATTYLEISTLKIERAKMVADGLAQQERSLRSTLDQLSTELKQLEAERVKTQAELEQMRREQTGKQAELGRPTDRAEVPRLARNLKFFGGSSGEFSEDVKKSLGLDFPISDGLRKAAERAAAKFGAIKSPELSPQVLEAIEQLSKAGMDTGDLQKAAEAAHRITERIDAATDQKT